MSYMVICVRGVLPGWREKMDVAVAEEAERAAKEAVKAKEAAIRQEIEDAKARINAAHADELRALRLAENETYRARVAAENAAVQDHEWTGKIVLRREYERKRWGDGYTGRVTEKRGVVETYRHGTELGRGHRVWEVGRPIVRLLKKDGTPGTLTEDLENSWPHKLPDENWHIEGTIPRQAAA